MFVTLMEFRTYCDLHVYIRPLFLDDVVLKGIATRQHQGYERMSISFCTHIVLSNSRIDSVDRLRLGAETTDLVVVLDKGQLMLGRVTIYEVNDVTFVATGPIPQICTKGISQATPDGFKSVHMSSHSIKPTPEREIPTRGRSVEPKRASGGDAPARTLGESTASGSDAPARGTLPASRLHTPTLNESHITLASVSVVLVLGGS